MSLETIVPNKLQTPRASVRWFQLLCKVVTTSSKTPSFAPRDALESSSQDFHMTKAQNQKFRLIILKWFHIILFMEKIWLITVNRLERSKHVNKLSWITCLPKLIPDFILSYIYRVFSGWGTWSKAKLLKPPFCEEVWRENLGCSMFLLFIRIIWSPYFYRIAILNRIFQVDSNWTYTQIPETQRRKEQPVVANLPPQKKNV